MAALSLPPGGLEVPPTPSVGSPKNEMTIPQIIQLNLENGMLYDLMRAARHGGARKPQLSFGRNMALHYGHQQRALVSKPANFPSFLYEQSDQEDVHLHLLGQFTHDLDLVKPEEDAFAGDSAVAQLHNSLALKSQAKNSHQITVLSKSSQGSSQTKTPSSSVSNRTTKPTAAEALRKSVLHTQSHTCSLPSSPAMAPVQDPPPPGFPTKSQQVERNKDVRMQRLQSMRRSLIHLVAHRQVSTDFIMEKCSSRSPELKDLISKVCRPWQRDEQKWDLKDQSFKELDVWGFPYSSEDRDIVIQRAIAAYDRMRISPLDEIFQGLLPKKERNQGKSLSKLDHLNKGPIKSNGTPKIKLQQPDEGAKDEEQSRGRKPKSDEGGPKSADRAKSHDTLRKTKSSERDTQSNRTMSNGLKKAARDREATKTSGKKVNAPLSAEFVKDSDEEDGLDEADGLGALSVPTKKESSVVPKVKTLAKNPQKDAAKPPGNKKAESPSSTNGARKAGSKEAPKHCDKLAQDHGAPVGKDSQSVPKGQVKKADKHNGVVKRKAAEAESGNLNATSRPRNLSSPHKPSPLGSSPPANVSDIEHEISSSASSTPLISKSSHQKSRSVDTSGVSTNGSSKALKRKSDDVHKVQENNAHLSNGATKGEGRAIKRARTNVYTPPTSDSPSPQNQTLPREIVDKAQNFKSKFYPKYRKVYLEVQEMEFPTDEKLQLLDQMHKRIEVLKQEIYDDHAKYRASN